MSELYSSEGAGNPGQSRLTALTPNQMKALSALLSNTSIEAAGKACGLNESTIRRYLREPEFSEAYREARIEHFTESVTALRSLAIRSVEAYESALNDDDVNVRLRAARSIWEFVIKGAETEHRTRELEEYERRLAEIEDLLEEEGRLP